MLKLKLNEAYMKRLFRNIKLLEVALLFELSLTPLLWLNNNYVIFGHDSGFRLNPLQHLVNLFYSWNPAMNLGADWSIFKGFLITQFPETIFTLLTGSLSDGQKFTFVFWFFVVGISMYIFINSFYSEKKFWVFRILGSVFYMYNFFILQGWLIAERAKFSILAALPLALLIIYKTINKDYSILKGVILFSFVFLFLNGGGATPLYGSVILICGLTFIYLTALNFIKNGLKEIFFSLKLMLCLVVSFLLINAYWVLPQLNLIFNDYAVRLSSLGGVNNILIWADEISRNSSIVNILRLQGMADWYDSPLHPYSKFYLNNPLLIVLSFLPIAVIIVGVFIGKNYEKKANNKLVGLMFIFLVVGIVLTAGTHRPFELLYSFFIKSIPGFAIFRSPFYKFGPLVWFSLIFLFAYYAHSLLDRFVKKKNLYNVLGLSLIIFILLYHFPFFAINFFNWNEPFTTKVQIPTYVQDMSNYMNSQTPTSSRILLLPFLDSYGGDGYYWGYWSLDPLPELTTNRSILARTDTKASDEILTSMYISIASKDEKSFLYFANTYGINKILWRNDILYMDKVTSSKDFSIFKTGLNSFRSVNLEKKIGEWSLYDIISENISPLIYAQKITIESDAELPTISFKKINPTEYIASVKNARSDYLLVFNEAFNKNWEAYIDKRKLLEGNHILANSYVNGWIMDRKGNYNITITYWPQRLVYVGTFISLATFLLFIFIILISRSLKTKSKIEKSKNRAKSPKIDY